jgi:hypothetical protein
MYRFSFLTLALATLTIVGAGCRMRSATGTTPPQPSQVAFDVVTPSAPYPIHLAVSPQGTQLATVISAPEGPIALWLRRLDRLDGKMIPGTESRNGGFPFWSPDGTMIGFFSNGKLKKVDLLGGMPAVICDASGAEGGTWNREGVIVFAMQNGTLYQVPDTGGVPTAVTELDKSRGEIAHVHPWFLPDGRHFVYLAVSKNAVNNGIWAGSLDSKERKFLLRTDYMAAFAPPNNLLFMDGTTLMARHFNPKKLEFSGPPFPVAEQVDRNSSNHAAGFTVSEAGTLAYRTAVPRPPTLRPVTVVVNWPTLAVSGPLVASAAITPTAPPVPVPPIVGVPNGSQGFVVPSNGNLYVKCVGGGAGAISEFGTGISQFSFRSLLSGLPRSCPTEEILVGPVRAGQRMQFGISTAWNNQTYWAFSNATDQGSLVAFTDVCNDLRQGGSAIQRTGVNTWLMHLNDAAHYTISQCEANNLVIQLRLETATPGIPRTNPEPGGGVSPGAR